ncbi:MAG: hypothetical protein AB1635_17905 [Acidobacteriota bacterium]
MPAIEALILAVSSAGDGIAGPMGDGVEESTEAPADTDQPRAVGNAPQ